MYIKPFPSGNASAGRHDQHDGKTEDECVSPSHNGGYEYSRIVPKSRRFHSGNQRRKKGSLSFYSPLEGEARDLYFSQHT